METNGLKNGIIKINATFKLKIDFLKKFYFKNFFTIISLKLFHKVFSLFYFYKIE